MSTGSRWLLFFFTLCTLFSAFVFGGCGRSALDDALLFEGGLPDGGLDGKAETGGDGGACNPATCPSGCCDPSGTCRSGTDLTACGSFGGNCIDCPTTGFDFCDVTAKACGKVVGNCNPKTCPTGCCERGQCLDGAGPDVCGTQGQQCVHCERQGQICGSDTRTCGGPRCGPGTCSGCCVGDVCVAGDQGTACGRSGQQCQNCAAQGIVCQPLNPGGVCEGNPSCGPQNCAGCCLGNLCVTGRDNSACGLAGQQCQNCAALGESCTPGPQGGFCAANACGPQNCKGCCQGNTCRGGNDQFACGVFGKQCTPCPPNTFCQGGQCRGNPQCGPQNCPGCCIGNFCVPGNQDNSCGFGGSFCRNCTGLGETCQGNQCTLPACGPQNCNGCCNGNICVQGAGDMQCGTGGQRCQNCTALGDVCRTGLCVPPPTCTNCAQLGGCCDPQLGCVGGFTNDRCGSGGVSCVNCAAMGSTCDTNVSPRVCNNQQTTCPAPYPACPGNVTTPVLPQIHVCTTLDLQSARAACSGGPGTPGCTAFFQFEQQSNPACAACLKPFDVPFQDVSGLFTCVAPFVSPQCDHNTGCATDCLNTICSQCQPAAVQQCRNDVRSNQCGPYFQQSNCVGQAFFGAGSFCNPGNPAYQGNFGAWLQGVGGHYCGP